MKYVLTHPVVPHYDMDRIQLIDYVVSQEMDFLEGNVIKYVTRYKHKGDRLGDLRKARQYLEWLIEREEQRGPRR